MFLGSNIDAAEVGADLGFQCGKSMTYVSTSVGVTAAFDSVANLQFRKRTAGVDACSVSAFNTEDRRRARGERGVCPNGRVVNGVTSFSTFDCPGMSEVRCTLPPEMS